MTIRVTGDDHVRGRRGAPVTLVEYGDYECPHSGRAYPIVQKLIQMLGDQLCFVFRNFPVAEEHPHAQSAAEAAEAADDIGGADAFWEMHDTLFTNQDALGDENLVEYARALGMNASEFAEALESGEYGKRVRRDVTSGSASGVRATPAFFVNGERYDGDWSDVAEFAAVLTAGSPSP